MKIYLILIYALLASVASARHWYQIPRCPRFKRDYSNCQKTGGVLPEYFTSVEIKLRRRAFHFTTQTFQGPQSTKYIPDRIVRLGSDWHHLHNGTVLPDLPSHESSFCEAGTLFRSEVTFLPDDTFVREELQIKVAENGKLMFEITVGDEVLLQASCDAADN